MSSNLPADTAGGEEEPVHEDTGTVVVRIVGQQSVPLVLLLTGTVSATAECCGCSEQENEYFFPTS